MGQGQGEIQGRPDERMGDGQRERQGGVDQGQDAGGSQKHFKHQLWLLFARMKKNMK